MIKNIDEIVGGCYGECDMSCEPTRQEIAQALEEQDFETRCYQDDLQELKAEWRKARNCEDFRSLVKKYHTRRIAYFVAKGWQNPITLRKDGRRIEDGLHRFKAAQYKGDKTIDVTISETE